MMEYKDVARLQDEGTQLLIGEILDGMQRYIEARRSGHDQFEYRGSLLNIKQGLERVRADYFEEISQLSRYADRDVTLRARLRFLEINEMEAQK